MESNEMEFLTDVADMLVKEKFGEVELEEIGEELFYPEPIQDYFNEIYDELEDMYIRIIKNQE